MAMFDGLRAFPKPTVAKIRGYCFGGGVALACAQSWERPHWPAPEAVAEGMRAIAENHPVMAEGARRRAVARFDIAPWIERHRAVFTDLLAARS